MAPLKRAILSGFRWSEKPGQVMAALRHHGFRPSKRYIVFQVLPDTLGLGPEVWRVLSKCHDMRNRTEYEGVLDVDDKLVSGLIDSCRKVAEKVTSLPPLSDNSK